MTRPTTAPPVEARLRGALREVEDPEMPVNIVDLGIVYGVSLEGGVATVKLTFTAMGCPASEMILEDIEGRLLRERGVREVRVEVVWDPPWSARRLTPEGREALLLWGLAV